jgi:hypothetical protein
LFLTYNLNETKWSSLYTADHAINFN